jgi:hypothetical protein
VFKGHRRRGASATGGPRRVRADVRAIEAHVPSVNRSIVTRAANATPSTVSGTATGIASPARTRRLRLIDRATSQPEGLRARQAVAISIVQTVRNELQAQGTRSR